MPEEGAILSTWYACVNGRRHPGLRKDASLRGATSERGPRSVRLVRWGSSPAAKRTGDSGCPLEAKEGNAVGMRNQKAHAPHARTKNRRLRSGRTRPSLGPRTRARRSPLTSSVQAGEGGASRVGIAVGQTHASGRNRHRGRHGRAERGSPRVTASARERRDA